jgi:hypothetical protein
MAANNLQTFKLNKENIMGTLLKMEIIVIMRTNLNHM